MNSPVHFVLSLAVFTGLIQSHIVEAAEETQRSGAKPPCSHRTDLRQPLFGDLHVHTAFSMDAYVFGTRGKPSDAYRFARGEAIKIAPLDDKGNSTHKVQLERPLDFAAVTDHAENLGSTALCTRPDSAAYDTESCRAYRGSTDLPPAKSFTDTVKRIKESMEGSASDEVCGKDGRQCRDATAEPWQDTQDAAKEHYDQSSECDFTTFVAYEYSLSPELSKVHRNVIFRSDQVLETPIHSLDVPEPLTMLRMLRDQCIDGMEGCDVLAIPHNSNLSDGRMFRTEYPGSMGIIHEQRAARLRAEMEPVVEMMQIKGDSECRNGFAGVAGGTDEFCDFEKMRNMAPSTPPDCNGEIGAGALIGKGCVDRNDFVRYALVAGLAEEERIGVNPFRFGFAASTDVHDGTMGDVDENAFANPAGRNDVRWNNNPGGLFAVWAEENSRESIFDAIRRREVYGTSGPRITPRFFGGWALDEKLCDDPDQIKKAYAVAVPMGAELPNASKKKTSPGFLVSAQQDPGTEKHPGSKLERVQIIKGWVGKNGVYEQRVYDVAGDTDSKPGIDTESCAANDAGHQSLCTVWQDPEFNSKQRAVYYSRVIEVPSCRWTTLRCNALPKEKRPAQCEDPLFPKTVQERAWTSPIWYSPEA